MPVVSAQRLGAHTPEGEKTLLYTIPSLARRSILGVSTVEDVGVSSATVPAKGPSSDMVLAEDPSSKVQATDDRSYADVARGVGHVAKQDDPITPDQVNVKEGSDTRGGGPRSAAKVMYPSISM